MGITAELALAKAKKYTDETVIGGGAIKGKNCTISKIEEKEDTTEVTFKWTLDDGTVKTQVAVFKAGRQGEQGEQGVSVANLKVVNEHLIATLDDGTVIDCGVVGSNVPQELIDQITENKIKIGNLVALKVGSMNDLVEAINAVYDLGASKFEYADKKLNITTRGGVVIPIDVSAVITDTNIDEFKNVTITDVVDGQSLVFDLASGKWTNKSISSESALEEAKEYTDEQISKLTHADAIACDEKPVVGADSITYVKDGVTLSTENFDTWFYYKNDEGKAVQTIWIDGVEFTLEMAGEVDLTQYVEKIQVTDVFEENPADTSKIPSLKYMQALRLVILTALNKKINIEDIVDDLLSDSSDKVLSAKQGKELKAEVDNKVDKVEGKSLIDDTEINRLKDVDNYDDTDVKAAIDELNDSLVDKVPFKFGITEDGQYGYIKDGADTVTPFKSGGKYEFFATSTDSFTIEEDMYNAIVVLARNTTPTLKVGGVTIKATETVYYGGYISRFEKIDYLPKGTTIVTAGRGFIVHEVPQ